MPLAFINTADSHRLSCLVRLDCYLNSHQAGGLPVSSTIHENLGVCVVMKLVALAAT